MINSIHYYAVSALFNGLFGVFVVYYIYLRNRKNPINRSFMYFGIAVSGWSLIYSLWAFAPNAALAEMYVHRHLMFEAFIPATFFHFAAHFTDRFERYKKAVIAFYILGLFYAIAAQTPAMVNGVKPALFFEYWPVPGYLLPSHLLYFSAALTWGIVFIVDSIKKNSGKERWQAIWVLGAVLIGFGGGSVNWLLWFDIPVPPMTNFFVGLMFAMMAYAIVRHGLMDVDALIEVLRNSRTATLGLLAASLSHELRNPLYIAKGRMETHLDAVERGVYAEPEKEILKSREIVKATLSHIDRAMDIVQRFSGFARPYRVTELKEEVVVGEVVKNVLSFVAHEFEMQKIRVVETPDHSISIHVHRRQLEEILFNLILNACHAMKDGGDLAIRAIREKEKVTLEIADTGPGIPPEIQKRIFDPFFTTKGKDGTGLGLYITKQLVERNGGKISIQSNLGQGAAFVMEFKR